MNEQNYASLKASKKLVDTGIVLETEAYWWKAHQRIDWILQYKNVGIGDMLTQSVNCIPAPSMAEVWRELPAGSYIKKLEDQSLVWNMSEDGMNDISSELFTNANPTDALIDLLIWVRRKP